MRPTLLALAASFLVAAPAMAQDGEKNKGEKEPRRQSGDQLLEKADADKDGKLSRDEYLRDAYEKFQKQQQGGQGGRKGGRGGAGGRLDKDGNGEVSFEEFAASPMAAERFKQADKDGSGFLEKGELDGATPGAGRAAEIVKRFDADKDGKVSREEFKGNAKAFDRLDRNKDGFLSPEDEAAAAPGEPKGEPKPAPQPDAPKEPAPAPEPPKMPEPPGKGEGDGGEF